MINNRIELEKSYISNSMFTLLMYPQENTCEEAEIRKAGVLDLDDLLLKKKVKILPGGLVLLNNQDLHRYIIS